VNSGWMGRREWMGMMWNTGSDRRPGRLLRECRCGVTSQKTYLKRRRAVAKEEGVVREGK